MSQQQSPLFQSKYHLFFALNALWRSYVSPKKSIAEFQIIMASLVVTQPIFWVQTAVTMLPRVCLSVFVPACVF